MKKTNYLNEFHRERTERLRQQLAKQPKASLAEAMEQYDRIKRGSSRGRNDDKTNTG